MFIEAVSQLDRNEAIFSFIVETASLFYLLFTLNGDFDQYLNNFKPYIYLPISEKVLEKLYS